MLQGLLRCQLLAARRPTETAVPSVCLVVPAVRCVSVHGSARETEWPAKARLLQGANGAGAATRHFSELTIRSLCQVLWLHSPNICSDDRVRPVSSLPAHI